MILRSSGAGLETCIQVLRRDCTNIESALEIFDEESANTCNYMTSELLSVRATYIEKKTLLLDKMNYAKG